MNTRIEELLEELDIALEEELFFLRNKLYEARTTIDELNKAYDEARTEIARLKEQLADGCDGKCAAGECICETVDESKTEIENAR